MPRTIDEILNQADELAARFEEHRPDTEAVRDATTWREVRRAFLARADVEQRIAAAVERARADEQSWGSIGAMLGTSGEAARQKYAQKTPGS